MDFGFVVKSFSTSVKTVAELWPVKTFIVFASAVLTSMHAIAFYVFCALIILDLFTKIISLSQQRLTDIYGADSDKTHFFEAIRLKNISAARRDHYIKSSVMKHRFSGKIFLYITLTLSGVCVDYFAVNLGYSPTLTYLIWMYLAATELCSILENLQDAGYEEAGTLHHLIKDKVKYVALAVGAGSVLSNDDKKEEEE